VVTPFALPRQRQHKGAGIINGAQHPTVLGRERIRRERLGEVVGREDHLQFRKGCPPSGTLTSKVTLTNGQECMA
jgi:hypothetical protein